MQTPGHSGYQTQESGLSGSAQKRANLQAARFLRRSTVYRQALGMWGLLEILRQYSIA
jgi:hypothetical protein